MRSSRAAPSRQATKTTIKVKFHPAQDKIFRECQARFIVANCGRRFGKTLGAGYKCLIHAVQCPKSEVSWIAPSYRHAEIPFRWMRNNVPKRFVAQIHRTDRYIDLTNGSRIWFRSADNPDSLLGIGYDLVIVDEAARIPEEVWWEYIYPGLMDNQGKAILISSPWGRNWFFKVHGWGQDLSQPDWASFTYSTRENPTIHETEIIRARDNLPGHVFDQQINAEFLDSAASVFSSEAIDECINGDVTNDGRVWNVRSAIYNHSHIHGVDVAKIKDYRVHCVVDRYTRQVVYFERQRNEDYPTQSKRIRGVWERYPGDLWIDSTGVGEALHDLLRETERIPERNLNPFKFTNDTKKNLVTTLNSLIDKRDLSYPRIQPLIAELKSFEFDVSKFGAIRYQAPSGQHDDCVFSLALAAYGLGFRHYAQTKERIRTARRRESADIEF